MTRKEVVVSAALTTAAAVVGVVILVRHLKKRSKRRLRNAQRILRRFAGDSATPVPKLWHLANELASEMQAGQTATATATNLRMLVSYLEPLPSGEEKGTYYGIKLRGTNFLIVRARLEGRNEPVSDLLKQEIAIPSAIANGDSTNTKELFDFIALELAKFISVHMESDKELTGAREKRLGFTISCQVDQVPSSSGSSVTWNSLPFDDTDGKELANEINQALEKHGIDMRVSTLVNDTIGDLAGGRYYSKESVAAVTLGMGTDVAYIESPQEISTKLHEPSKSSDMVINMRWGNFTSSHLPLTEYDVSLDVESMNPGGRIFEKLISGMYLGEIVRRVLLKMAQEASLFGDPIPPKLSIPYLLRSPDMAAMHQDTSEDYDVVEEKLREVFEIHNSTPTVREIVVEVCDVVAERGARLVGAGIVGIVKKLGRIANKKCVIIIEGGLYEHYRVFRNYLHSSVWEMLGSELSDNVIIQHSHGGSGAGSIFLAAAQTQNEIS